MRTAAQSITAIAVTGAILFGFYLALPPALSQTIEYGVSIGEWLQKHNI